MTTPLNHHYGLCPHADTHDGWIVADKHLLDLPEGEDGQPRQRIEQLLVCVACDTAITRRLTVEHEYRSNARDRGFGWSPLPVRGHRDVELLIRGAFHGDPYDWDVVRGGLLIGSVWFGRVQRPTGRGRRERSGYLARAIQPVPVPVPGVFDRWSDYSGTPAILHRLDEPARTLHAAAVWIISHSPATGAAP